MLIVVVSAGNSDLLAAMKSEAVTLAQGAIPGLQPGAVSISCSCASILDLFAVSRVSQSYFHVNRLHSFVS
jgi:hypothetical protein